MHKNATHNLTYKIPEYAVWNAMKRRCDTPSVDMYPIYGGRGIKVCDRWLGKDGFQNFLSDLGRRPSNKHQIDRINCNGHYTPENCRWVTAQQNSRNRTNNTLITYKNQTKSMAEWCEIFDIKPSTLCQRLYRSKWPIDKALETPVRYSKR